MRRANKHDLSLETEKIVSSIFLSQKCSVREKKHFDHAGLEWIYCKSEYCLRKIDN